MRLPARCVLHTESAIPQNPEITKYTHGISVTGVQVRPVTYRHTEISAAKLYTNDRCTCLSKKPKNIENKAINAAVQISV